MASELQIDTATYCKIERSDRKAKREHVVLLSRILKILNDELITLWLADQIIEVVKDEKELAGKTLRIVQQYVEEDD